MRALTSILVFLFATSTLFGLYHWWLYQNTTVDSNEASIEETVVITEGDQSLQVKHEMMDVKPGVYDIIIPDSFDQFTCESNRGSCEIEGEQLTIHDTNDLNITYELLVDELIDGVVYLEEWIVELNKPDTSLKRNIQLALSGQKNGKWLTSIEPIIATEREAIDYYEWHFNNEEVAALVKFKESFDYTSEFGQIRVLSDYELNEQELEHSLELVSDLKRQILVKTDQLDELVTNHLVINDDLENAAHDLFQNYFKTLVSEEPESWVLETLTSYFLNSEADNKLVQELENDLTEEQKELFYEKITTKGIDDIAFIQFLDETLSGLVGYDTSFFSDNKEGQFIPLHGNDSRSVLVGESEEDISHKLKHDEIYFSLTDFMDAFELSGFKIEGRDEWFIDHQGDHYRFYLNRHVYSINDQRYSVNEESWFSYREDVYFKSHLLGNLFELEISIRDDRIVIE
ncbi:hypothetical protein [Alkalibacillus silvisoli]|uniref:Copper amine oxidase-like N-terminal domain-containing protein n=1 Tax=Alkalibacillus silvisoli TaxID=392823 RepID=A0ABN0ZWA8_9BACI